MKNCLYCEHAEWQKTSIGKLHPSGNGQCKFPITIPKLPMAFYWIGGSAPTPCGGHIERKAELKDHCPYYDYKSPNEK
jgi:hypothetical protein